MLIFSSGKYTKHLSDRQRHSVWYRHNGLLLNIALKISKASKGVCTMQTVKKSRKKMIKCKDAIPLQNRSAKHSNGDKHTGESQSSLRTVWILSCWLHVDLSTPLVPSSASQFSRLHGSMFNDQRKGNLTKKYLLIIQGFSHLVCNG